MILKALLLDLDGTLVDTAPDMIGALNRQLKNHNKPKVDYDEAKKLVSKGAAALVQNGFMINGEHPELENLRQEYLKEYEQNVCKESRLFDGMQKVLELCQSNNIRWGIVTNKPYYLAKPLIEQLAIDKHCSILLGGDSLPKRKPHPMPLLHCCVELSLAASDCIYIGDDERDIKAGKAAGMDTASAAWGYIPENEDIENWGADFQVNSPQGLLRLIKDLI